MTDMNKNNFEEIIKTAAGDYKISTHFGKKIPEKEKTLHLRGTVIATDGNVIQNGYEVPDYLQLSVVHGGTYIVTEEVNIEAASVIRTMYGTVTKGQYLEGKTLQKIYDENAVAISAAAKEYGDCPNEFLLVLHRAITCEAKAVLGRAEIIYGVCRSRWKGDAPHGLYCKPVLAAGRVSAPLRLEVRENFGIKSLELWLDNEHPAADIRKRIGYHRSTSVVAVRKSDNRGIDLGNSRWPKGLPETAENVGKVIDLYGSEIWDDVMFHMGLSEEAILKAVNK